MLLIIGPKLLEIADAKKWCSLGVGSLISFISFVITVPGAF